MHTHMENQLTDKDTLIVAQVAGKIAAELAAIDGDTGTFGGHCETAFAAIMDLAGHQPSNVVQMRASEPAQPAEDVIRDAFPGASTVGPITAQSSKADLWADFFRNRDDWFNNIGDERAKSGGGKGPDVKHKTIKSGQYAIGLWIDSKDTPAWVKEKLAGSF